MSPLESNFAPSNVSNTEQDSTAGNISNGGSSIAETNTNTGERNTSTEKKTTAESPHIPDENILVHLLEMCKVFDLSDEMGRYVLIIVH
jgi:hypothetical protein